MERLAGESGRLAVINSPRFIAMPGSVCVIASVLFPILFLGVPASIARGKRETSIQKLRISPEHIQKTIIQLQAYGNRSTWENQWKTAYWIADQFEAIGIKSEIQAYQFKKKSWPNVTASLPGKEIPSEIIMLTAHLDSKSDSPNLIAPGADDNGSGVAVLMEIARAIRKTPLRRSVMFAVFSNEERGEGGSKAFVKRAIRERLNIEGVINLDVLGYNRPSWPVYIGAITSHYKFKHQLKAVYKMFKNYAYGLFDGKDVIKVAGREPNVSLVEKITKIIKEHTSLKVKSLIGEGCG